MGHHPFLLFFSFIADILPPRWNILLSTECIHAKISGAKQEQTLLSVLMQCAPTRREFCRETELWKPNYTDFSP